MNLHNIKKFTSFQEVSSITEYWIGSVYRSTASVCWNLLNTGQLSFEETKILFTENIVYNYIEFMKSIKAVEKQNPGGLDIKRAKLT